MLRQDFVGNHSGEAEVFSLIHLHRYKKKKLFRKKGEGVHSNCNFVKLKPRPAALCDGKEGHQAVFSSKKLASKSAAAKLRKTT